MLKSMVESQEEDDQMQPQMEFEYYQRSDLIFPLHDNHPQMEYDLSHQDITQYIEYIQNSEIDMNLGLIQSALSKLGWVLTNIQMHRSKENINLIYLQVVTILNNQAIRYLNNGELQNALLILEKCEQWISNNPNVDPLMRALTLSNIGVCYRKKGKLSNSLDMFNEALKLMIEHNIKSYLSNVYLNFALVHAQIGAHIKSLEFARKALTEAQFDLMEIQNQNGNSGESHQIHNFQPQYQENDRSKGFLSGNFGQQEGGRGVNEKRENKIVNLVFCYRTLAQEEEHFQNYDEALHYYESAVDTAQQNLGSQNQITLACMKEFSKFSQRYSTKYVAFQKKNAARKLQYPPSPFKTKTSNNNSSRGSKLSASLSSQSFQKKLYLSPYPTTTLNAGYNNLNLLVPSANSSFKEIILSAKNNNPNTISHSAKIQGVARENFNSMSISSTPKIQKANSNIFSSQLSSNSKSSTRNVGFLSRPVPSRSNSKQPCITQNSEKAEIQDQLQSQGQGQFLQRKVGQFNELEQLIATPPRRELIDSQFLKGSTRIQNDINLQRPRVLSGNSSSKLIKSRPTSTKNLNNINMNFAQTAKNSPSNGSQNIFKTISSPYFQPIEPVKSMTHKQQFDKYKQFRLTSKTQSSHQLLQNRSSPAQEFQLDTLKIQYQQAFLTMKDLESKIKTHISNNRIISSQPKTVSNQNIPNLHSSNVSFNSTQQGSVFKTPLSSVKKRNLRPKSMHIAMQNNFLSSPSSNGTSQKGYQALENSFGRSSTNQQGDTQKNFFTNYDQILHDGFDLNANQNNSHNGINTNTNFSQEPTLLHEIKDCYLKDSDLSQSEGRLYEGRLKFYLNQVKQCVCAVFSSLDLIYQLQHVINISDISLQNFSALELQFVLVSICNQLAQDMQVDSLNNCLTFNIENANLSQNKENMSHLLLTFKELDINIILKNPSQSILYSSEISEERKIQQDKQNPNQRDNIMSLQYKKASVISRQDQLQKNQQNYSNKRQIEKDNNNLEKSSTAHSNVDEDIYTDDFDLEKSFDAIDASTKKELEKAPAKSAELVSSLDKFKKDTSNNKQRQQKDLQYENPQTNKSSMVQSLTNPMMDSQPLEQQATSKSANQQGGKQNALQTDLYFSNGNSPQFPQNFNSYNNSYANSQNNGNQLSGKNQNNAYRIENQAPSFKINLPSQQNYNQQNQGNPHYKIIQSNENSNTSKQNRNQFEAIPEANEFMGMNSNRSLSDRNYGQQNMLQTQIMNSLPKQQRQLDIKSIYGKVQEVKRIDIPTNSVNSISSVNNSNIFQLNNDNYRKLSIRFADTLNVLSEDCSNVQNNQVIESIVINHLGNPQKKQSLTGKPIMVKHGTFETQLQPSAMSPRNKMTIPTNQMEGRRKSVLANEIHTEESTKLPPPEFLSPQEKLAGKKIWGAYVAMKFRKVIQWAIKRKKTGRFLILFFKKRLFRKIINQLIERKKEAAKTIQTSYRSKKSKKEVLEGLVKRKAAVKLQRFFHKKQQKQDVLEGLKRRKAAKVIQRDFKQRKVNQLALQNDQKLDQSGIAENIITNDQRYSQKEISSNQKVVSNETLQEQSQKTDSDQFLIQEITNFYLNLTYENVWRILNSQKEQQQQNQNSIMNQLSQEQSYLQNHQSKQVQLGKQLNQYDEQIDIASESDMNEELLNNQSQSDNQINNNYESQSNRSENEYQEDIQNKVLLDEQVSSQNGQLAQQVASSFLNNIYSSSINYLCNQQQLQETQNKKYEKDFKSMKSSESNSVNDQEDEADFSDFGQMNANNYMNMQEPVDQFDYKSESNNEQNEYESNSGDNDGQEQEENSEQSLSEKDDYDINNFDKQKNQKVENVELKGIVNNYLDSMYVTAFEVMTNHKDDNKTNYQEIENNVMVGYYELKEIVNNYLNTVYAQVFEAISNQNQLVQNDISFNESEDSRSNFEDYQIINEEDLTENQLDRDEDQNNNYPDDYNLYNQALISDTPKNLQEKQIESSELQIIQEISKEYLTIAYQKAIHLVCEFNQTDLESKQKVNSSSEISSENQEKQLSEISFKQSNHSEQEQPDQLNLSDFLQNLNTENNEAQQSFVNEYLQGLYKIILDKICNASSQIDSFNLQGNLGKRSGVESSNEINDEDTQKDSRQSKESQSSLEQTKEQQSNNNYQNIFHIQVQSTEKKKGEHVEDKDITFKREQYQINELAEQNDQQIERQSDENINNKLEPVKIEFKFRHQTKNLTVPHLSMPANNDIFLRYQMEQNRLQEFKSRQQQHHLTVPYGNVSNQQNTLSLNQPNQQQEFVCTQVESIKIPQGRVKKSSTFQINSVQEEEQVDNQKQIQILPDKIEGVTAKEEIQIKQDSNIQNENNNEKQVTEFYQNGNHISTNVDNLPQRFVRKDKEKEEGSSNSQSQVEQQERSRKPTILINHQVEQVTFQSKNDFQQSLNDKNNSLFSIKKGSKLQYQQSNELASPDCLSPQLKLEMNEKMPSEFQIMMMQHKQSQEYTDSIHRDSGNSLSPQKENSNYPRFWNEKLPSEMDIEKKLSSENQIQSHHNIGGNSQMKFSLFMNERIPSEQDLFNLQQSEQNRNSISASFNRKERQNTLSPTIIEGFEAKKQVMNESMPSEKQLEMKVMQDIKKQNSLHKRIQSQSNNSLGQDFDPKDSMTSDHQLNLLQIQSGQQLPAGSEQNLEKRNRSKQASSFTLTPPSQNM